MDYHSNIKRHKVTLCKHVSMPPQWQVWVEVLTKISGLIHKESKNSLWTGVCVCSANGINEIGKKIILTNFFTIEKKLPEEMGYSYATRIPGIHSAVTSTLGAGICESLILIVDQAIATPIWQLQT